MKQTLRQLSVSIDSTFISISQHIANPSLLMNSNKGGAAFPQDPVFASTLNCCLRQGMGY
jgi:hypothetical protein